MSNIQVGDMARVNGDTFFSGFKQPEGSAFVMATYTQWFGRVGVVTGISKSSDVKIYSVRFDDVPVLCQFAPYQLEKLANISPE